MAKYKMSVSVNGENFFWIVVNNGKLIKNPTKDDLRGAKSAFYNNTNICHICRKENNITDKSILYPHNACHEKDKSGKETGKWVCSNHRRRDYQRYDTNSTNNTKKLIANCRTGNQNPNHESTKGDGDIDIACKLYGYENLNKKYDNYEYPIDCIDPKTGLFYQIRGRLLGIISTNIITNGEKIYYEGWNFSGLAREWYKEYEDMVCFCKSKDGKVIERIYRFPLWAINGTSGVTIYKNHLRRGHWYEQYRVKDLEELKKANNIWKKIIEENNYVNPSKPGTSPFIEGDFNRAVCPSILIG